MVYVLSFGGCCLGCLGGVVRGFVGVLLGGFGFSCRVAADSVELGFTCLVVLVVLSLCLIV